jgi:hypothetical protein
MSLRGGELVCRGGAFVTKVAAVHGPRGGDPAPLRGGSNIENLSRDTGMTAGGFWAGIPRWWRWRTRRAGTNIYGVAEFGTLIGTVVAAENHAWRVEDDDGRLHRALPQSQDLSVITVGDKVEMRPRFQRLVFMSFRGAGAPNWVIVRKL